MFQFTAKLHEGLVIAIIVPLPFVEATGTCSSHYLSHSVLFFFTATVGPGLLLLQISKLPVRFCPAILSR